MTVWIELINILFVIEFIRFNLDGLQIQINYKLIEIEKFKKKRSSQNEYNSGIQIFEFKNQ